MRVLILVGWVVVVVVVMVVVGWDGFGLVVVAAA